MTRSREKDNWLGWDDDSMLELIAEHEPLSLGGLAELAGFTNRGSAQYWVRRLEARGLVERNPIRTTPTRSG